jgi:hypothetical protein
MASYILCCLILCLAIVSVDIVGTEHYHDTKAVVTKVEYCRKNKYTSWFEIAYTTVHGTIEERRASDRATPPRVGDTATISINESGLGFLKWCYDTPNLPE